MDNLAHSMTAVVLARAGLNRLAPRATVLLLLACNAPDIDVVSSAWGSLSYLRHHRGLTHSLAGAPLVAAVVVLVLRLVAGRGEFAWGRTFGVALAGVASHVWMDFTNVYGVRPWLPFRSTWYNWDIVNIVDLWLWSALAATLVAPALGRLVSGEIGARAGSGRAAAVLCLAFVVAWWGARDLLHRRAVAMLAARSWGPDGAARAPLRVAAFPDAIRPWVWRGLVETERFYALVPVDVRRPLDPGGGRIVYKPEASAALEAALATRTAREFAAFAQYRFARVEPRAGGHRVVFSDFRFTGERPGAFLCTIEIDQQGRVAGEDFSF